MSNYAYHPLGDEPRPGHETLPVWKRFRSSRSGYVRTWSFYGIAATCGIIIQALIFTPRISLLTGLWQSQCLAPSFHANSVPVSVQAEYVRPGLGQLVVPYENRWSQESLREMVSRTKGYYARDYSVWLGWNNMRYIIETAALHAKLLNRTLIIPSYIYARSCEWKIEVCAMYATMVNRGDVLSLNDLKSLQIEKQMGWLVPIQTMIDLDTFRKRVPVITVAQYLEMHGLPATLEVQSGYWDLHAYHSPPLTTPPSLAIIPQYDYDRNLSIVRMDRLPEWRVEPPQKESPEWEVYQGLLGLLNKQNTLSIEAARQFLKEASLDWQSESEMAEVVSKYGFTVVYTYGGLPSAFSKAVNNPVAELAPAGSMRGFIDDYNHYTERVLLLQGEIHGDRKPGAMAFASAAARDNYTDIVLRGISHVRSVQALADVAVERMRELNNGRMWMAGHWRRGDFVRLNWHKGTPTEAIDHILSRFEEGTERLGRLRNTEEFRPPPGPGIELDQSFNNASLPLPGDRWFLATDERDPQALAIARAKNATRFSDLIESTPQLRRLSGWPMMYTDVLALVEQEIMARSAFFFAYAYSSVSGGVVNLRSLRGMDPRTMILDGT